MAISAANAFAGGSNINSTVYSTASYAFAAGKLYTIGVHHSGSAKRSTQQMQGGGLSWSKVTTNPFSTIATPLNTLDIWQAISSVTATGSVTLTTSGTVSRCCWVCDEWTEMTTVNSVVQSSTAASNLSTALLVNIATPAAGSATYGVFGVPSFTSGAMVVGTGYTLLSTGRPASEAIQVKSEWRAASTVANVSSISIAIGGIAIEISSAAAAGAATIRQLIQPDLHGTGGNRFLGNLVEFVGESQFVYEN